MGKYFYADQYTGGGQNTDPQSMDDPYGLPYLFD